MSETSQNKPDFTQQKDQNLTPEKIATLIERLFQHSDKERVMEALSGAIENLPPEQAQVFYYAILEAATQVK